LDDIIDDLTIPDKHRSKTYVPVEILKIIYNSMQEIYKKLDKIQEDVDLNQISKKIDDLQQQINNKTEQITEIH